MLNPVRIASERFFIVQSAKYTTGKMSGGFNQLNDFKKQQKVRWTLISAFVYVADLGLFKYLRSIGQ